MQPPAGRSRRLSFYRRLTRAQKAEYDRSDRITAIPLSPRPELGRATNRLVAALAAGAPPAVRGAAQDLLALLCAAVVRRGLPPAPAPRVKVLRRRPRLSGGEYHGLYTRDESGRAEIRVWMLTAAHREVVRPRTFLRTLLHELVHHFDVALLDLPSSFHTIGFHARESSLLRALERSGASVPGGRPARARKTGGGHVADRARGGRQEAEAHAQPRPGPQRDRPPARPKPLPPQLDLFAGRSP